MHACRNDTNAARPGTVATHPPTWSRSAAATEINPFNPCLQTIHTARSLDSNRCESASISELRVYDPKQSPTDA